MKQNDKTHHEPRREWHIVSQRDLASMLGVSVMTVHRLGRKAHTFHVRRRFSNRAQGWLKHETGEWITSRPVA